MPEKDELRNYINKIKDTIKATKQRFAGILLPVLNYLDDLEKMDNTIEKIFNENLIEDDEKYIKSLDQKNLENFQKKLTEYLINIVILDEKHISEQAYKYIKSLEQIYKNQIKDIVNSRLIEYKSSHSAGRRIIYLQEILNEIEENNPHSPLQNLQNLKNFTKEEVTDALKKYYEKINSDDEQARMVGSYYFAEIWNGEIVAIGNEEGNYCGGVLATSKNKEELIGWIDKLKTSYETLKMTDERSNIPSWTKEEAQLYEKIKDMKISDTYPDELVMIDKKGPVRSWNE